MSEPSVHQSPEAQAARARARELIAEKQNARYRECYLYGLAHFGPGWLPSHRHMLIEHAEECAAREEQRDVRPAHTIYTLKNAKGEQRHFQLIDGKVVACHDYRTEWKELAFTPDPSRPHKDGFLHLYSLCFAPFEQYHPLSAEQLEKLRQGREAGKADREQAKWEKDNPLFSWADKENGE